MSWKEGQCCQSNNLEWRSSRPSLQRQLLARHSSREYQLSQVKRWHNVQQPYRFSQPSGQLPWCSSERNLRQLLMNTLRNGMSKFRRWKPEKRTPSIHSTMHRHYFPKLVEPWYQVFPPWHIVDRCICKKRHASRLTECRTVFAEEDWYFWELPIGLPVATTKVSPMVAPSCARVALSTPRAVPFAYESW